jgi:hypothetical protein
MILPATLPALLLELIVICDVLSTETIVLVAPIKPAAPPVLVITIPAVNPVVDAIPVIVVVWVVPVMVPNNVVGLVVLIIPKLL